MKVSIIVIVYNTEKYLERCLNSLINQTYNDIEIIIVDDGSTDNSIEIINSYEARDSRVKKVIQKNKGCVTARNSGAKVATGDYYMFIDSDDWVEENAVEELIKKIQLTNADMIKYRAINEPSKKIQKSLTNHKDTIFDENRKKELYNILVNTTKLNNMWNEIIKKEVYDTDNPFFKEHISQGDDFLINLEVFYRAKKILIIDDIYYHYFKNDNSITQTMDLDKRIKNIEDLLYVHKVKREYLKKFKINDEKTIKNIKLKHLNVICNQICKILVCDQINKSELIKLQALLIKDNFYDNIKGIDNSSIKDINLIKRLIKLNIINKHIDKCYKYRYIIYLYMKIIKYH